MNKVRRLIVGMAFAVLFSNAAAANDLRDDLNITIVSSPKLGVDTVCVNQSVNLSCFTDQRTNITWFWLNQSKEGSTITVKVTQYAVVFTCKASAENGQVGKANVTVIANGTLPYIRAVNFYPYIEITEGKNITLTASLTSNLLLSSKYPNWNVLSNNLPPTAKVINYTIDGVIYSNLSLYDLSYYDDTGNYTCTASNECGTSSVFTFIKVKKAVVNCNNSMKIIKSLQNSITVSKEYFMLNCLFQGRLGFSVSSYWKVDFPPLLQHKPIYISTSNSIYPYQIAVNPIPCKTCCFASQLTILSVPPELNGANLTCVGHSVEINSEQVTQKSTSTLTVLNYPKIIDSSGSEVCPKINENVSLHCTFNTSTMEGATIVVWLKDKIEITGHDNETKPVKGVDNELMSILNIKHFSHDDQGDYTCYCYYNKSIVTSHNIVTSDQATLHVYTDCSHSKGQRPDVKLSDYDKTPHEGTNMNITANISSSLPITSLQWAVSNGDLPASAMNHTSYDDEYIYNTLSLFALTLSDSGNYTFTARNCDGNSTVTAYINVGKEPPFSCHTPGFIISLPSRINRVVGQTIPVTCLFRAILQNFSPNSSWNVTFPSSQHTKAINIHDNSTDLFYLAVYQLDFIKCIFINKLIIRNVSQELNRANLTCIESDYEHGMNPSFEQSVIINVYDYPEVLNISVWPNSTTVNVGDNITLLCYLEAPKVGTVVEWSKDDSIVTLKHYETAQGNEIVSNLTIINVTHKDEAKYTCGCFCNRSIVTTERNITCNTVSTVVHVKDVVNNGGSSESKEILGTTLPSALGVVIIIIIVIYKCRTKIKKKSKNKGLYTKLVQNHSQDTDSPVSNPGQASSEITPSVPEFGNDDEQDREEPGS